MKMNILSLISLDGFDFKKVASTNGGEFKGPCPWCGGDDRFTIWPEQNRYICRQCKQTGDAIQYLRDFRNMTYHEACIELNIQPDMEYKPFNLSNHTSAKWEPRQVTQPPQQWQRKAERYLFESYKYLLSAAGKKHRDWLNDRGLTTETIKAARLGWNPASTSFDRESWGLVPETAKSGKQKNIWIPEGLIIPYFEDNKVVRLRIRQENPITSDRFLMVAGSSMAFMSYSDFNPANPSMIVEAELDGWLLHQAAGDLVNVFAIGNAQSRPDAAAHNQLIQSAAIILNLDADEAGRQETQWWLRQYDKQQDGDQPHIINWPCSAGKDAGEAFQQGIDIRAWVEDAVGRIGAEGVLRSSGNQRPSGEQRSSSSHQLNTSETASCSINTSKNFTAKDFIDVDVDQDAAADLKQPAQQPQPQQQAPPLRLCRHNKHCSHMTLQHDEDIDLDVPFCLSAKERIYQMDVCPKELWWVHRVSPVVEQVIIGPVMKRRRQKSARSTTFKKR